MARPSDERATYPPLDVPKPVATDVWVVDSGPLHVLGMRLPVRMTVVRLAGRDLWLHSPTGYSDGLRQELERAGRIRHLVAPDIAHWSFLQDWQRACPDAVTWAAPGLRDRAQVRKAGIRLDRDLAEAAPPEWAGEIEQVVVRGKGFSEVDFFHSATRTLVLTDLVQNFEPDKLTLLARTAARVNGVLAPAGGTPLYLRWILRANRQQAKQSAQRLVGWNPERVLFSHGRWFDRDGAERLRRSLGWLLN
jgi:hypothetical protein